MAYLLFATIIAGLLMFLLCGKNADAKRIGEMLLFGSILALLIAVAPNTVKLFTHG